MLNPLRSEEDAFRFTLIVAVLIAPVALAAIFVSTAAALAVGGGVTVGLIVGLFVLKRDEPKEKMLLGRPTSRDTETRRILVVANETLTGHALRREIAHRASGYATELRVVCPALNTKIKHWVSDEDEARRHAQERLDALLAKLEREGVEAEGGIGDSDPVQAMEDALRLFPADEVIISTHPPGRSNWLERGVIERARERFPVPVSHVVVDLEHERAFEVSRED
jgi:nucleotide-binding universal stress UspA family protein